MDKEIMKGSIDLLLLSLISQKAMYGYELAKIIKEKSDDLYKIGEGTLYPALKRLEVNKAIESFWGESAEGARRKYYRITNVGRTMLEEKMRDWKSLQRLISLCYQGGE